MSWPPGPPALGPGRLSRGAPLHLAPCRRTLNSMVVPGGSATSAVHTWPSSHPMPAPLCTCAVRGAAGRRRGWAAAHAWATAPPLPAPLCAPPRAPSRSQPHLPVAQGAVAAHQAQALPVLDFTLHPEPHRHVATGADRQRERGVQRAHAARRRCPAGAAGGGGARRGARQPACQAQTPCRAGGGAGGGGWRGGGSWPLAARARMLWSGYVRDRRAPACAGRLQGLTQGADGRAGAAGGKAAGLHRAGWGQQWPGRRQDIAGAERELQRQAGGAARCLSGQQLCGSAGDLWGEDRGRMRASSVEGDRRATCMSWRGFCCRAQAPGA